MAASAAIERLGARDLRLVLDAAYDLQGVEQARDFPAAALAVTIRLVACDIISYNEVDLVRGTATALTEPLGSVFRGAPELLAAHAADNPLVVHQATTGDGAAQRLSDWITLRQLRRRPLYGFLYGPMGVNYQLAVGLGGVEGVIGIALNRGACDFSDRDVAVLETLRPFLAHTRRRLARREPAPAAASGPGGPPLTERQAQILALVAQGATNAEVAARLMISEHTVAKHLEHVYRGLGVSNRTAAIASWRRAASADPRPSVAVD